MTSLSKQAETLDGHYTSFVDQIRELKRLGKLNEAEKLLLQTIDATEAENWGVAPWYYDQLAIVYRKQKKIEEERGILVRFAKQLHAPGARPPKLLARLQKLLDQLPNPAFTKQVEAQAVVNSFDRYYQSSAKLEIDSLKKNGRPESQWKSVELVHRIRYSAYGLADHHWNRMLEPGLSWLVLDYFRQNRGLPERQNKWTEKEFEVISMAAAFTPAPNTKDVSTWTDAECEAAINLLRELSTRNPDGKSAVFLALVNSLPRRKSKQKSKGWLSRFF